MLPHRPLLIATALLAAFSARADDLSAQKVAEIQSEQQKAQKAVEKKYGNRQSSEMTNDERRQMIADTQAAAREVFDKHGVTGKDFAIREARLSRGDRAAVDEARAAIAAREEAERSRQKGPPIAEEPEIQIIRGTSDEKPLEVFRDDEAVPIERPNEDGVIEPNEDDAPAEEAEPSEPMEIDPTL